MLIIGCDYRPGFQRIAFVGTETGECGERRITQRKEAQEFYDTLKERRGLRGDHSLISDLPQAPFLDSLRVRRQPTQNVTGANAILLVERYTATGRTAGPIIYFYFCFTCTSGDCE
jgi:hypothetical protein